MVGWGTSHDTSGWYTVDPTLEHGAWPFQNATVLALQRRFKPEAITASNDTAGFWKVRGENQPV